MVVKLGNLYYFIYLIIFVAIIAFLWLILKNRKQSTQYKVLLAISFASFIVHFLKLLIPKYYDNLPLSIRKITFENICAVSTIIFPFILLSKNKYARDYMFYMGLISGLASVLYPMEAFNKNPWDLDTIRFYFCHMIIFIVPFFMVIFRIHSLNIKRILAFPIMFLAVEALILVNEIILMEAGFVDFRSSDFLTYNYRNSNFIFGPTPGLEKASEVLIEWMVPTPFKQVMVGEYAGSKKYTPLLWLVVPVFVYFSLLYAIIYFIFGKLLKRKEY
jgi:hypothetical protein